MPKRNDNPEVYVELNHKGDRAEVHVEYARDVRPVKHLPGSRLTKATARGGDGQVYTVPADLHTIRRLRETFGDRMGLGPRLRRWARDRVKEERNLKSLHTATDATLTKIPDIIARVIKGEPIPELELPNLPNGQPHPLMRERPERPYQRADIAMMSLASAMNLNEVGTGKTLETVGAVYEAGLETKPGLIIGPKRSLTNTWQTEFERFTDLRYFSSENPRARKGSLNYAVMEWEEGRPVVVGSIAEDWRLEKYRNRGQSEPEDKDELHACNDYKGNWYRYRSGMQRNWYEVVKWGYVVIDEFHRTGINVRTNLFAVSMDHLLKISGARLWLVSATPMGGKPRRLWHPLHLIDRKEYSAEWSWIAEWLEMEEEEFYKKGDRGGRPSGQSKKVGGIRPDKEDEFYEHHKKHMVRRTKKEALPGIPDMIEMVVEAEMTRAQRKLYDEFDKENELILSDKRISGKIMLAKYTHLRALANVANGSSGKLEPLLEALNENGVRRSDYEPGARAYIGCSTKGLVTFLFTELMNAGISALTLTGETKDSNDVLSWFNGPGEEPRVIVMTTQTGGVSLSLEAAGSAHLADESWDPDEATQFFGRGDRGTRTTPLRCYTYRTKNSIQQYVAEVCEGKLLNNKTVMKYAKDLEGRMH